MRQFEGFPHVGRVLCSLAIGAMPWFNAPVSASDDYLERTSFSFPVDAQPNSNEHIGPFCCTGRTAIVTARDRHPVAYVYYYDFPAVGSTSARRPLPRSWPCL